MRIQRDFPPLFSPVDFLFLLYFFDQPQRPENEHTLLRYCLDACKVMHFLRAMQVSSLEVLQAAARVIRRTWMIFLDIQQLLTSNGHTLPLRTPGLGNKDPSGLQAPARMACILSSQKWCQVLKFPPEACQLPPDFVKLAQRCWDNSLYHCKNGWTRGNPPMWRMI